MQIVSRIHGDQKGQKTANQRVYRCHFIEVKIKKKLVSLRLKQHPISHIDRWETMKQPIHGKNQ
jgi:hypothetical protein